MIRHSSLSLSFDIQMDFARSLHCLHPKRWPFCTPELPFLKYSSVNLACTRAYPWAKRTYHSTLLLISTVGIVYTYLTLLLFPYPVPADSHGSVQHVTLWHVPVDVLPRLLSWFNQVKRLECHDIRPPQEVQCVHMYSVAWDALVFGLITIWQCFDLWRSNIATCLEMSFLF